jgi:hypothetical protein
MTDRPDSSTMETPEQRAVKATGRPQRSLPLPTLRRRMIYLIASGTWLTGCLWLVYHYFIKVKDQFGFDSVHPLEKWWLIFHAAFGFWAVWMFGNLWLHHIKLGWTIKARWISGGSLFLFVFWLIGTGYLLYYLGDAKLRGLTSLLHWIPGLAVIGLFFSHLSFAWLRPGEARPRRQP